jgi:hypothetical protein
MSPSLFASFLETVTRCNVVDSPHLMGCDCVVYCVHSVRIDTIITLITRHSGPRGGIQIPVCLCCTLWIVTAKKK